MAIVIHPSELIGEWDSGYALDTHVIKSTLLGEDAYGHKQYDNTRSQIGELLYQFKYKNRYENLELIVDTIIKFLDLHPEMKAVDTILPVPPTKDRLYQPTFEIAEAVAEKLDIYYCNDVLENISNVESKGLPADEKLKLGKTIIKRKHAKRKHSTLLIDDLYETGNTLTQCVRTLREDPLIDRIYVLTVTKTRK